MPLVVVTYVNQWILSCEDLDYCQQTFSGENPGASNQKPELIATLGSDESVATGFKNVLQRSGIRNHEMIFLECAREDRQQMDKY